MTKSAPVFIVVLIVAAVIVLGIVGCYSINKDEKDRRPAAPELAPASPQKSLRFPLLMGGPKDDLFYQPRVAATSPDGLLFIMDKWGTVRAFDDAGTRRLDWTMPYVSNKEGVKGLPESIAFDTDGTVIIADTHYSRVLFFTPGGQPLPEKTIGREGREAGEFCYPSGLALDRSRRRLYVDR